MLHDLAACVGWMCACSRLVSPWLPLFTFMKLTFVGFCSCGTQAQSALVGSCPFTRDSEHLFSDGLENYHGGPVDLFKSFFVQKNGESF